jgi:hypothetical protein
MKRIKSLAVSVLYGIGIAFWTLNVAAQANLAARPNADPRVVVQFDEASLAKGGSIEFQRGVFRIDDSGQSIAKLCLPVNGQWKQVGDMHDCGNPPPPVQQREIFQFSPDKTILGVRNLGVDTEQWKAAHRPDRAQNPRSAVEKVSQALSFNVGDTDVRWHFDSQKLPDDFRAAIPGSGIHVHFGGFFSEEHRIPLFDADGRALEVELSMAIPKFTRSGKAHSGVTLAVDLSVPTNGGRPAGLPVIVSLFSPDATGRENLASDGRTSFVATLLAPGSRYIQSVENHQRSAPWPGLERFAFMLTRENVKRILADANARRRAAGSAAGAWV